MASRESRRRKSLARWLISRTVEFIPSRRAFDLANRLRTAQVGAVTWGYTYDGVGRRLTRTRNGSVRTRFSWDPQNELPELALERTAARALISRYEQGPAGPVSQTTPSGAGYYHRDPLGSIRAVTDETGAEQWSYDYDPYGEDRATTQTDPAAEPNPVRYTGEALDTETSLYHLRARQYDGDTGSFRSIDPIEEPTNQSPSSVYSYAQNRPLVLIDPSGMTPNPSANPIPRTTNPAIRAAFGTVTSDFAEIFDRKRRMWITRLGIASAGGNPNRLPSPKAALRQKYYPWGEFDWSADDCSIDWRIPAPAMKDFGRRVAPACRQHDFCYRNSHVAYDVRDSRMFTRRREYCDRQLRKESEAVCVADVSRVAEDIGGWRANVYAKSCGRHSTTMYRAVVVFGAGSFRR